MNIFVTHPDPAVSAKVLPDKHVVKMPLESCQMLSIIYSKWYFNWGDLHKKDGTAYFTEKGGFRNHPCTAWAAKNIFNTAWLIQHGCSLAMEYTHRYGKVHGCAGTLFEAKKIFNRNAEYDITCSCMAENFARAMPDKWKYDKTIDTYTAYKRYIASKTWAATNYLRDETRKPEWL